jgi:hypothetical protein
MMLNEILDLILQPHFVAGAAFAITSAHCLWTEVEDGE